MDTTVAKAQLVSLNTVADQAKEYVEHSKATNTVRAYRSDWQGFSAWCDNRGVCALPATPQTVAMYLTDLAGQRIKASTLQRRMTTISQAHQMAGHESPTTAQAVRSVMKGIRRVHGTSQTGKAPAKTGDIRAMVSALPDTLLGIRDRALLLLGFAGAFRRSELVSIDIIDVERTKDGVVITVRRSKTDQEGHGRRVGIPYGSNPDTCPVRALEAWLEGSAISDGAVFRSINRHAQLQLGRLSDKAVALVVKRCAEAAGLDPAKYAGHSLRAGLATSAAEGGVSERAIMNQTGHKSLNMVRKYIREGSLFRDNAAANVGL